MKVVEEITRDVHSGGGGETRAITIAANGTIIRNTIKGIYSNKERTITRELMANAFDAHVVAGCVDTPVEVYLPTTLDPVFSVRDFGCGMSHDFVMEHYSALGFSTKSDSNDQTGMFGVGSKSPLAISDSFTVRCFDKPTEDNPSGRVRLYTVFFDDSGNPKLQHTFSVSPRAEDQVERGGTEVKVPVGYVHKDAIISGLAEQQFAWFDRAVKFDGATEQIDGKLYHAVTPVADGVYVARLRTANRYASSLSGKIFVRQGSAVYPLDENQLSRAEVTSENIAVLRALTQSDRHLMIDLPIGTADVTMARESLQYNEATLRNLKREINEAIKRFSDALDETITPDVINFPLALEALSKVFVADCADEDSYAHISSLAAILPLVKRSVQSNYSKYHNELPLIEFQRPLLKDGSECFAPDGSPMMETYKSSPPYHAPQITTRLSPSDFSDGKVLLGMGRVYSSYGGGAKQCDITTGQSHLSVTFPNVFYVIPSHLPRWQDRIRKHATEFFKDISLPDRSSEGVGLHVVRCGKRAIEDVRRVLEERGVEMLVFGMDDLPDLDDAGRAPSAYSKTAVYVWNHALGAWDKTKIEPDYTKPAYYLTRVQLTTECFGPLGPFGPTRTTYTGKLTPVSTIGEYALREVMTASKESKLFDSALPIYRVAEKQYASIREDSSHVWTDFMEMLAPLVESRIKTSKYAIFNSTDFRGTYGSLGNQLAEKMLRVASNAPFSQHHVKIGMDALQLIKRVLSLDPVLPYHLVASHVLGSNGTFNNVPMVAGLPQPDVVSPADSTLIRRIFGMDNTYLNGKDEERDALDEAAMYISKRFRHLTRAMNALESRHTMYYIEGVLTGGGDFSDVIAGPPLTDRHMQVLKPLDDLVNCLYKYLSTQEQTLTKLAEDAREQTDVAA